MNEIGTYNPFMLNNPLKYTDPSGYLVSGGTYTSDYAGINSALLWNHYNYYDRLYGRQEFVYSGGGWLSSFGYSGGYLYQFSNTGTVISTNHEANGIQIETSGKNRGIYVDRSYVERTVLPRDLAIAIGIVTINTFVKNLEFFSMESILSALEYQKTGGYSSPVMQSAWQNNEENFWREHNMIRHNAQKPYRILYSDPIELGISYTQKLHHSGIGITIGLSYINANDGGAFFFEFGPSLSPNSGFSVNLNRYQGNNIELMLSDFEGYQETATIGYYGGYNRLRSLQHLASSTGLDNGYGEIYSGYGFSISKGVNVSYSRTYSIKLFDLFRYY